MAGKMESGGKVLCPVCSARANNSPFGNEPNRKLGTPAPLSTDPVITKRRERARALARQNRVGA